MKNSQEKNQVQVTNSQTKVSIGLLKKDLPVVSSRHASQITVHSALKSDQLSKIRKEEGEPILVVMVTKMLQEFFKFVPNDMTDEMIVSSAEMIIYQFWMVRIDELIMILNKGMKGEYGKLFGKVYYSTIAEWINHYLEKDRQAHLDLLRQKKKNKTSVIAERSNGDKVNLRDLIGNLPDKPKGE